MTPTIAILVVESLVKYGPTIADAVHKLLSKDDPTQADIDTLIAKVQALDFDAARNKARAELAAQS